MHRFVVGRDRAASPQNVQNGQSINPDRQAIAANAKIPMTKRPTPQETHQPQAPTGIPSRGFRNAQDGSAAFQHGLQRRQSDRPQKQDGYDTDADSIDTTVNHSVIQVDDSQARNAQYEQHGRVVDLGSADSDDDDEEEEEEEVEVEEAEDGGDGGIQEDYVDADTYPLSEDAVFLPEQAFGMRNRPEGFGTVDGDSYPSTTDGHPTEWDGIQVQTPGHHDGHLGVNSERPLAPPPMQRGSANAGTGRIAQGQSKIIQQSAHLRGQQRANSRPHQQSGRAHQPHNAPMQSSQPLPSYSQATRDPAPVQPSNPNPRSDHRPTIAQPQQPIPRQQPRAGAQPTKPLGVPVTAQNRSSARVQILPDIQYQNAEPAPLQEEAVHPDCDYDAAALEKMEYDRLKNESFDINPRASDHPLSNGMREKSLEERLAYVQKKLDVAQQSEFFHDLPTAEWEDAGDWFLEQFSDIIKRTKEARQKKRKLAQGFEDEIEKRHKHVSKKFRQVEDAMSKMQTQGEGLVPPRSPKPSKSPKPKKR
jgi:hypothetical protein